MRSAYRKIALFGIIAFGSAASAHIAPDPLSILGWAVFSICLVYALISTAIVGISKWRKQSRFWLVPSALCIAFLVSLPEAAKIGVYVGDWQFRRHLDEYVGIVDAVKKGTFPCGPKLTQIEVNNRPPHVNLVWAACCPDGSVTVDFYSITGVPLVHAGYLFRGGSQTNSCMMETMRLERRRWPYQRRITENWYRCSDQPGL